MNALIWMGYGYNTESEEPTRLPYFKQKHFTICVKQHFLCFCSIFALAFVEIWLFLAARWRKFCHFAFPKIQIELHFPFSPDYRQHINSNLNSCGPVPQTHIWVWEIMLLLISKEGSGSIQTRRSSDIWQRLSSCRLQSPMKLLLWDWINHFRAGDDSKSCFELNLCREMSLGWIWRTKSFNIWLLKVNSWLESCGLVPE